MEENFDFLLAFTAFDMMQFAKPDDLDLIGTFSVTQYTYLYDPIAVKYTVTPKDIKYHPCTPEDMDLLGHQIREYVVPGAEHKNFCLDKGQEISLRFRGESDKSEFVIEFNPCSGDHCYDEQTRNWRLKWLRPFVYFRN